MQVFDLDSPVSLSVPVSFCTLYGIMYAGELFLSYLHCSHHTAALYGDTLDRLLK